MNSLPILKALYADIKNCEHWLSGENERALAGMENRILDFARQLREARDERLATLKKDGPRVSYDGELNVVLLRKDKEEYHNFAESLVKVTSVVRGPLGEDGCARGPLGENGRVHCLLVQSTDSPIRCFGIDLTKEEAVKLEKAIPAAKRAYGQRYYGEELEEAKEAEPIKEAIPDVERSRLATELLGYEAPTDGSLDVEGLYMTTLLKKSKVMSYAKALEETEAFMMQQIEAAAAGKA